MKRIAVFTGTRAEYGLLYWLLKEIQAHPQLQLQIVAAAMHCSPEFGETYRQIEADGFTIDAKLETLLSSNTSVGVAKSMGLTTLSVADALERLAPDMIVILGDRFEALACAQAAMVMRIPVVHLHGGEITEGAYDDAIRHAITKLSHLHVTSTEPYRQRVIQLGEQPSTVFNYGAIGLDHLKRTNMLSVGELSQQLAFDINKPYLLMTYHPVTLGSEPAEQSFEALCAALDQFADHQIIMTYPNADEGGRAIIPMMHAYAAKQPQRVLVVKSLGQLRYLSAVKHADAVVGNSSSGIIEVPSFNVGTVDIGARQQGRLRASSVIQAQPTSDSIASAITKAITVTHSGEPIDNPYGQGNAAQKIVALLADTQPSAVKTFYNIATPLVEEPA